MRVLSIIIIVIIVIFCIYICHICGLCCLHSQCGQGVQRVEGSGVHGGNLVVIEWQQTHRTQPHEAAVAHTADAVAPQHATHTKEKSEWINLYYS